MMQRRNAASNGYYFVLVLSGVILGVVSRRLEVVVVVLPLAIALLYSRLHRTPPVLLVSCQVASGRAFEGDRVAVALTVQAEMAVPPLELWHWLPPGASCTSGANRVVCLLKPGQSQTFHHDIVFPQRGVYTLGRLYVRLHPATDLQPWLAEYPYMQECRIYPRVTPLPSRLLPGRTHASFGNYVARATGEGVEFAGIRPYNHGDRLRRVHWRTSLARQQLYVTDYYSERNADVVLLLDTLASIPGPQSTSLDVMVRVAASLAAHYLYHKDRVGLVQYGGVCTWVPPAAGQYQWYRLLNALLETRVHFSYLLKDISMIPPRILPPGALVLACTSLLDGRIETALRDLLARSFQVVLIVISPAQIMPPGKYLEEHEAVKRLWRLETELRLQEWRRMGVPVVLHDSADLVSSLLQSLGQRAGRR